MLIRSLALMPLALMVLICCSTTHLFAQKSLPLSHAHAHNDYRHARPLLDAIDHGFCGIEADVFLVDGKLLVGHDRKDLQAERTLTSLYLDPLHARVKQNGGGVYDQPGQVMLLVDIKSDGAKVYAAMCAELTKYRVMLSCLEDGRWQERAIKVVISGDRPKAEITADTARCVGIDGRMSDLDSKVDANLMPLISENWLSHFTWFGNGEFKAQELEKLRSIVSKAHGAGRKVRFWATPENPQLWKTLLDEGVDYLNTDNLDLMQTFLTSQAK